MRERIPIAADPSMQGTNGHFCLPQWADTARLDLVVILRDPLSGGDGAPLTQTLTESFCERCGTRYEFTAPTRLNPLRKTRGLFGGFEPEGRNQA